MSPWPLPQLYVRRTDGTFLAGMGETVTRKIGSLAQYDIVIAVDFTVRNGQWELVDDRLTIKINSNLGELAVCELSRENPQAVITHDVEGVIWLRAEMYGVFHGVYTMIGFTNPIYIKI